MKLSSVLARPMRPILAGFLVVAIACLAVGWTAGTVAASHTSAAAPTTVPAAAVAPGVPDLGVTTAQGGNTSNSSGAATTTAMYPIQGYNSLGAAPEGTILAEGTGTADVKADGSDKASALKKATDLALADARSQAAAVAVSMGVQIKTIYSVSTAVSTNYVYATPDCAVPPVLPVTPDGGISSSNGAGISAGSSPAICIQTKTATPASGQLVVTLIVAYTYA